MKTTLRSAGTRFVDALRRLERAWERTDALFAMVPEASLLERPIELRHPLIFYVGHLPAFARNLLVSGVLERPAFRPDFDSFFDFGIDPEEGQEEHRSVWPALGEILDYRNRVRSEVRESLSGLAQRRNRHPLAENARILHLVREHEEMHHETLLYLLSELDMAHKRRPTWWRAPVTGAACAEMRVLSIPAGPVTLGVDFAGTEFGWDNEFPARTADVGGFRLASLPATVGEFLEFLREGGYSEPALWDEQDWPWIAAHGRTHPQAWTRRGEDWFLRTMFEYVPLEHVSGWPASVSLAEARAFARWRGARLASEAELRRAAFTTPSGGERAHPWGDEPPGEHHGAFAFHPQSPLPVGSRPGGDSAWGVSELVGNGWEWTATPFLPHEGFVNYVEDYPGYSQEFFDGKHFVLLGGSWATAAGLLRRSFRNWFRHNYPYPFTKFRLAWDA